MSPEKRDDLLVQEYWELQKIVDGFSARALTVKTWSVTFSAAAIGLAFSQHEPMLLLVSAVSALVFWMIEAGWKAWQLAFFDRIKAIEDYYDGKKPAPPPLQASREWEKSYGSLWRFHLGPMAMPHVMLPHVPVALAALVLFALWPLCVVAHP